jgi:hypothetical protein
LLRGQQAKGWPTARGSVLRSEVVNVSSGSVIETEWRYLPAIEYRYTVASQPYRAKTVNFDRFQLFGDFHHAKSVVAMFPVGSTIDVRYDPSNSQTSVLITDLTTTGWLNMIIGLVLFVSSSLGFYFIRIHSRNQSIATEDPELRDAILKWKKELIPN